MTMAWWRAAWSVSSDRPRGVITTPTLSKQRRAAAAWTGTCRGRIGMHGPGQAVRGADLSRSGSCEAAAMVRELPIVLELAAMAASLSQAGREVRCPPNTQITCEAPSLTPASSGSSVKISSAARATPDPLVLSELFRA
jgi:hypothetical protein